ncbi:hypothetical protein BaRGS_00022904 [Batillaria attramentaria]|uniref:Uncharacterized protein n=1 Tax=Batillaria attramentaria TaxID=370345 RepID=A0ABD0KFI8_9CAEN
MAGIQLIIVFVGLHVNQLLLSAALVSDIKTNTRSSLNENETNKTRLNGTPHPSHHLPPTSVLRHNDISSAEHENSWHARTTLTEPERSNVGFEWPEELLREPDSSDKVNVFLHERDSSPNHDANARTGRQNSDSNERIGLTYDPNLDGILVEEVVLPDSEDADQPDGEDTKRSGLVRNVPVSGTMTRRPRRSITSGDSQPVTESAPYPVPTPRAAIRQLLRSASYPIPTPKTSAGSRHDREHNTDAVPSQPLTSATYPVPTPKARNDSRQNVPHNSQVAINRGLRSTPYPIPTRRTPSDSLNNLAYGAKADLRLTATRSNYGSSLSPTEESFWEALMGEATESGATKIAGRNVHRQTDPKQHSNRLSLDALLRPSSTLLPEDLLDSDLTRLVPAHGVRYASPGRYVGRTAREGAPLLPYDDYLIPVSPQRGEDEPDSDSAQSSTANPVLHGLVRPTPKPTKQGAVPTAAPTAKPFPRSSVPARITSTAAPTPQPWTMASKTPAPTLQPGRLLVGIPQEPVTTYAIPPLGAGSGHSTTFRALPGATFAPVAFPGMATPAPARPLTTQVRDLTTTPAPSCVGQVQSMSFNRSVPCTQRRRRRAALSVEQLTLLLQQHGGSATSPFTAPTLSTASATFRNMLPLDNHHTQRDIHERFTTKQLHHLLEKHHQPRRDREPYYEVIQKLFGGENYNPSTTRTFNLNQGLLTREDVYRRAELDVEGQELEELPEEFLEQMIPASHIVPRTRSRRTKRTVDTGIGYCQSTRNQTAAGLLHLCSACQQTTDLGDDVFPRYINEVVCNPAVTDECLRVGNTVHGRCRQTSLHVQMLRRRSGRCMMVIHNGQRVLTDEWELYAQEVRTGCQCMLDKRSPIVMLG